MRVTGLMPIKGIGRKQETLDLIPRLFATTGNLRNATFDLVVIVDDDPELHDAVFEAMDSNKFPLGKVTVIPNQERLGYWKSLAKGAKTTDAEFLVNLANDVLPSREWLSRALKTYRRASQELGRDVMVGFNDLVHPANHAGHCLFSRAMLQRWYGDELFPTMYDHLHADVELVVRAWDEGAFVYSVFAGLFHNHIVNGKPYDPVYELGHKNEKADYQLYLKRRANGWN